MTEEERLAEYDEPHESPPEPEVGRLRYMIDIGSEEGQAEWDHREAGWAAYKESEEAHERTKAKLASVIDDYHASVEELARLQTTLRLTEAAREAFRAEVNALLERNIALRTGRV